MTLVLLMSRGSFGFQPKVTPTVRLGLKQGESGGDFLPETPKPSSLCSFASFVLGRHRRRVQNVWPREEEHLQEKALTRQEELLELVCESCSDPALRGPVVARATLWNGRVVTATYCPNGPKRQHPDAQTRESAFSNPEPLRPLIDRLLLTNQSFVTVTGTDDMVCVLEWTIGS